MDSKTLVVFASTTWKGQDLFDILLESWPELRKTFEAMCLLSDFEAVINRIQRKPYGTVVLVGPTRYKDKGSLGVGLKEAGLPPERVVFVTEDNTGFLCEHNGLLRASVSDTAIFAAG